MQRCLVLISVKYYTTFPTWDTHSARGHASLTPHEARSRVGAHSNKLWPYTRNWAKSRGWALFRETTVHVMSHDGHVTVHVTVHVMSCGYMWLYMWCHVTVHVMSCDGDNVMFLSPWPDTNSELLSSQFCRSHETETRTDYNIGCIQLTNTVTHNYYV